MTVQIATNWIKSNFLELVIAAMLAAFFVNYQADRQETKQFRNEMRARFDDHERRIVILEYISILNNPDIDEWQKEALLDYARKRGVTVNDQ